MPPNSESICIAESVYKYQTRRDLHSILLSNTYTTGSIPETMVKKDQDLSRDTAAANTSCGKQQVVLQPELVVDSIL